MKTESGPIELRLLDHIRQHHLLDGVHRLLVAVSGGQDSVCLLHVLGRLRNQLGIEIHVAHLDHQLRGENSAGDASYVQTLTNQLALPLTSQARDVEGYRAKRRVSLEEAAREVRYSFLAEVARSTDSQAVAVGHTRDDNVETILMHIVRGTGIRGLRGLLPVSDLSTPSGRVRVVHPLLPVTREETAAYCLAHSLAPRADETNVSLSMFRNRIRIELLPLLKKYNPRIEEALSRTARIAGDELSLLDEEAEEVWPGIASNEAGAVVLKKDALSALHPALKRHVLRRAISEFIGDLKDIETRHIEELLDAVEKPAGRVFQMPGGLVFVVEYDRYILGRDTVSLCPFPPIEAEFSLNIPGETVASGWKVTASILPRTSGSESSSTGMPLRHRSHHSRESGNPALVGVPDPLFPDTLTANFDQARIGDTLSVRAARPGDRFEPLGLGASKKVGQFMIDARIPRSWRRRVPVVVTPQHVAWVVGWRIDERVRISANTGNVLSLQFIRLS